MKVTYRQAANDDAVRQFRYYLLTLNLPDIALRFRQSLLRTVSMLRERPAVGARYNPDHAQFSKLRSWPVMGFEAIRIYYLWDGNSVQIIRILHSKRDIRPILERESL